MDTTHTEHYTDTNNHVGPLNHVDQPHTDNTGGKHAHHVQNEQPDDFHSMHGSHVHQAFFNSGWNTAVLFEDWIINTKWSLFLACVCTFVLALGYQTIKWSRQYLHVHYRREIHLIKSKEHLLQTVLYVTEFLVSYLLMLIVMTYNMWVFVVTILGIALGYFLLAWLKEFKPASACAGNSENVTQSKSLDPDAQSQELMPLKKETTT